MEDIVANLKGPPGPPGRGTQGRTGPAGPPGKPGSTHVKHIINIIYVSSPLIIYTNNVRQSKFYWNYHNKSEMLIILNILFR